MAQPDHFILEPKRILLIECKLTQIELAWVQLDYLYRPLLEALFEKPVHSVLACKNLIGFDDNSVVHKVENLKNGVTWHWAG